VIDAKRVIQAVTAVEVSREFGLGIAPFAFTKRTLDHRVTHGSKKNNENGEIKVDR
jgi:hypothetical protein